MTSKNMLLLRTSKGIETIDIRSIIRIEALSNYSKLYFTNGKTLVVAKVLHWFEKHLCMQEFFRAHRTHIVNNSFIDQYKTGKIKLLNGEIIDVAKRKRKFFLQKFVFSGSNSANIIDKSVNDMQLIYSCLIPYNQTFK